MNRVYKKTENGSYADVVRNIPLWLEQFPGAGTKVTISSADIPYICESVLHLYELGIHQVNINCVFEDVWHDGDDKLFEDQLMQLADAIIDRDLYKDYACSFSLRCWENLWTVIYIIKTGVVPERCLPLML